jgi:hypothetical protein
MGSSSLVDATRNRPPRMRIRCEKSAKRVGRSLDELTSTSGRQAGQALALPHAPRGHVAVVTCPRTPLSLVRHAGHRFVRGRRHQPATLSMPSGPRPQRCSVHSESLLPNRNAGSEVTARRSLAAGPSSTKHGCDGDGHALPRLATAKERTDHAIPFDRHLAAHGGRNRTPARLAGDGASSASRWCFGSSPFRGRHSGGASRRRPSLRRSSCRRESRLGVPKTFGNGYPSRERRDEPTRTKCDSTARGTSQPLQDLVTRSIRSAECS